MKKNINLSLFLVLIITSLNTNAQSTFKLKDLISQQQGLAAKTDPSAELQAILPEMSIIRQQYRLERNDEFFGKNNKPYYGESYSLAIKVSGGTIFLSDVIEPWKGDSDYARDNASGNYNTSLYWTYQRSINDANYNSIDLEIKGESDYVRPLNADKTLYMHTDAISDFGLSIDKETGSKKGYMIWAYTKSEISDSAMVVDIRQSQHSVEAIADSALVTMNPSTPEKIIGGIYVTPKFERGGRVQYLLSGVAVRNKSNGWDLQLLCSDDKITKSEATNNITKSNDSPKSESKKKKK
ncbi:MAG: hypothetical protein IIW93_09175 [Bacteroidaceae bacterium]|nr:hypothetical protein [Bacteroidaceae bacterium]